MAEQNVIEASDWQELVSLLVRHERGWLYRGQAQFDWKLVTKLERYLSFVGVTALEQREWELETISFFQGKASRLIQDAPDPRDLIEWLAVMQHYGAPTRLLDWSLSPFVGCYFAYADASPEKDAALWVLNENLSRRVYQISRQPNRAALIIKRSSTADLLATGKVDTLTSYTGGYSQEFRFSEAVDRRESWLLPIYPERYDPRFAAQQAAFTCDASLGRAAEVSPLGRLWRLPEIRSDRPDASLKEDVSSAFPKGGVLKKYRLRHEWRAEAIKTLELMNITAESLFPGLDGIGSATMQHVFANPPTERGFAKDGAYAVRFVSERDTMGGPDRT